MATTPRSGFWVPLFDELADRLEPEKITLDHVRGALRDGPAIPHPEEAASR